MSDEQIPDLEVHPFQDTPTVALGPNQNFDGFIRMGHGIKLSRGRKFPVQPCGCMTRVWNATVWTISFAVDSYMIIFEIKL